MKKLFTLRSFITWLILLIAMSALVTGLKEGVRDVQDATFFPVAAFAVTLGYMLGFSTWSARRVWGLVLLSGLLVAFIETAKLVEPIRIIIQSIPQFELELIRWIFQKENLEIAFPDTSIFQLQFTEITTKASALISLLVSSSIKHPSVREFIWDMPLLPLAAWAGWGISRRNQTLFALAPSLVLHTYILQYTGKDIFSLQFAVFALILLIGVNQKWNIVSEKTESSKKTAVETYSVILILSIAVTIAAGLMPSISIEEIAKRLTRKDDLGKALGLDTETAQAYVISGTSGLPRQHLIGLSPTLSETVIFTVKTGELAATENAIIKEAIPRHYWRWLTYDIYNGQGWATSPVESISYSANQTLLPITSDRYKLIHQQVEKAFTQDNRLYWTGSLVSASQPVNANWRLTPQSVSPNIDPLLVTDMLGAITEAQIYQANSLEPILSANQLRDSSQDYPQEIRASYLSLPESIPQRVLDLAQQLTADITNPYDKARVIEAYLRTHPYSLDITPPPPDRDVVDYFLFDLKKGYCDYYASSMVVLTRAVGLPARLVIGYASGIYDPTKAEYAIREADAHSWVEVYFAGVGWVEFEPTASQLQIILLDETPEAAPITSFPLITERRENTYAKRGYFPQANYVPLFIGLVFMISSSGVWFLRTQGLLRVHKTIGSIYEYVYYHGKKIYKDAQLNETPSIFADNLRRQLRTGYPWLIPAADEIKYLTDLYLQETYSAHPITNDERSQAIKIWRKLFWRLLYARVIRL